jgi:hypothetical protein
MKRMYWLPVGCIALLWLSSCGTGLTAGATCSANADCGSGACLSFDTFPDAGACVTGPKSCSKTCTSAADCEVLDPTKSWGCFGSCGGGRFCGQKG